MNLTKLYWVEGPWDGRLALSARPRGGDWLEDEVEGWRREGVTAVCSLLELQEEAELDLVGEADKVRAVGMQFISLPIEDRRTPPSDAAMQSVVDSMLRKLRTGDRVVVHCRQGVGRAGLTAACLFVAAGKHVDAALRALTDARGVNVPETPEQQLWLNRYADLR